MPDAASVAEGGVVLSDEVTVRFHPASAGGPPVADLTRRGRAVFLREGGERLLRVITGYDNRNAVVLAFDARTVSPDGSERRYDRSQAHDLPAIPSFALYSDRRAIFLDAKPATPGTVIDYEYTIRFREPRVFALGQDFGGQFPVRSARLEVITPEGWQVEHLARQLDESFAWEPAVRSAGTETHRVWERRNLAAVADEPLAPRGSALVASVAVRLAAWTEGGATVHNFRDERELSAWCQRAMNVADDDPRGELGQLGRRLVEGLADDPAAKARRVFAWVRDHIQYCAIEVGDGGYVPHAAGEVSRLRYGDCKDKANLLRVLLARVGVTSELATIYHHDGLPRPFGLAVIGGNFNHAIVRVALPGGPLLADPTSRTVALGELPFGDEDADVLPLVAGGSPLIRSPSSGVADNVEESEFELRLESNGWARGSFTASARGHFAERLRGALLGATEGGRTDVVMKWLDVKGPTSRRVELEHLAPGEEPAPLVAHGGVELAAARAGSGAALLRISEMLDPWTPALPDKPRASPLLLQFRGRKQQTLRLKLQPGAHVAMLPPPVELDVPWAHYALTFTLEGQTLRVDRRLEVREPRVASSHYVKAREFFEAVQAAEARGLVIESP